MNVKVLSHSFRGSVNTLKPFPCNNRHGEYSDAYVSNCENYQCDIIIHRAANASPMLEIANPVKTIASCILPFMSKLTAIYA